MDRSRNREVRLKRNPNVTFLSICAGRAFRDGLACKGTYLLPRIARPRQRLLLLFVRTRFMTVGVSAPSIAWTLCLVSIIQLLSTLANFRTAIFTCVYSDRFRGRGSFCHFSGLDRAADRRRGNSRPTLRQKGAERWFCSLLAASF